MARVESYTSEQIDLMLADQTVENDTKYATKAETATGLDASTAMDGEVPTADGAGNWYWQPGGTGTGSGSYRGDWNAVDTYEFGDQVSYNDVLWTPRVAPNTGQVPAPPQVVDAGDDGTPAGGELGTLLSPAVPRAYLHPIHVTETIELAAIRLYVESGSLPAMTVAIVQTAPAIGSATNVYAVGDTTTEVPARSGVGWHEIMLNDSIGIGPGFDYWVYVAVADTADLSNLGAAPDATSYVYTGLMGQPASQRPIFREDANSGVWQDSAAHSFMGLADGVTSQWTPLADYTGTVTGGGGGGAVDSVNGQTGVVSLDAQDVGAIPAGDITLIDVMTQAEYDALAVKVPTTLYVIQG